MNSNIIINVTDPLSNQDVVTKNYIHTHAFSTAGGVVSGDVVLRIGSDLVTLLGCNNLSACKKFILMLGSYSNILTYSIPKPFVSTPIELKTDEGFVILIDQHPICGCSRDLILCSQPIDMIQHSIKNVMSPVNKFDAVNKDYADRIKYKSATGTIPNTVRTDHTLFIFLATKDIITGKIIICEMWVERLVGELISTSSPVFATEWPGFHSFSRGPSLITFFNGSLLMVGHGIFSSTVLNYRKSTLLL